MSRLVSSLTDRRTLLIQIKIVDTGPVTILHAKGTCSVASSSMVEHKVDGLGGYRREILTCSYGYLDTVRPDYLVEVVRHRTWSIILYHLDQLQMAVERQMI